jgi:uncharacterized protein (TIRG00374 family)
LKKYQQFILGLVIASIALYYSLRNVAFEEVISSFKEMDYIYILPSVVIIILSYVFRAYRWQALLQSSLKVNVSGLFSPMMVGFMGNFLPARAAEILRPYLLSKKYPITFSTAFASIVMERLFGYDHAAANFYMGFLVSGGYIFFGYKIFRIVYSENGNYIWRDWLILCHFFISFYLCTDKT